MIFRNLRLVLSATVSSSALRMGTTAANGFPCLTTMIGSFLAFSAYFDSGPEAFFELDFCHSLMRRDRGAEKNRARGSYSWWGKMPVIVFVIVPPGGNFHVSRILETSK